MPSSGLHVVYAALGILVLIGLIAKWRLHPFLALTLVSLGLGLACDLPTLQVVSSYEKGFGDVAGHIGIIVGLGVILGALLVSSGAAAVLANSLVRLGGESWMAWTLCLAALLIGLPLFFEVSLVLLTPICVALAGQLRTPVLRLGIPMMAGIIGAHALLPPHPAPTIAVAAFGADAGLTLLYGIVVALPALAIAGPLYSKFLFRGGRGGGVNAASEGVRTGDVAAPTGSPSLGSAWGAVLLAPLLMLLRSAVQFRSPHPSGFGTVLVFLGDPIIALGAAVAFAIFVLGVRRGATRQALRDLMDGSLASAAGVILITGGGGGFKQVLLDAKIGDVMIGWAQGVHASPLVLAWMTAALLRVSIGTSTVATVMTSGLLAPLVLRNPSINRELMVLATGCGSVFGSHVNDPGFWFIKQYFNLSLAQTLRSWTVLTVLLAVIGLATVCLLARLVA